MAKKAKPEQPQLLSPEKYIRLKARMLPIGECYVNKDWQQDGLAMIIVTRKHQSGNYTCGQYLVDTLCLGLKDTFFHFNFTFEDLDEILNCMPECTKITYNEAHNIIFGAIAFAEEEAGITAHKNFQLTQYLLEEDTDDIPLIEYEFGKDGKPFLAVSTKFEASKYLPRLREKVGPDMPFLIIEEEFDDYEEMDEEEEEEDNLFNGLSQSERQSMIKALELVQNNIKKMEGLTQTTYAYVHPQYPTTLELVHKELRAILYNARYNYTLPHKVIKQILALPRESLIADLNRVILYDLGQTCDTITDNIHKQYPNTMTHVLFLLGELQATESLQPVLEILRQKIDSIDLYFGDSCLEVLRPTLYYIGRNQTEALLAFMKEPGLEGFSRIYISPAIATIAIHEPERREEIIDWYRQLLRFLIDNVSDSTVYDATVSGSIMIELIDIHASELLPEIEQLYATNQVNFMYCGSFLTAKEEILNSNELLADYELKNIYQRSEEYEQQWKY